MTELAFDADDGQPLSLLTYATGPGFGPYLSTNAFNNQITQEKMRKSIKHPSSDTVYPSAAYKVQYWLTVLDKTEPNI